MQCLYPRSIQVSKTEELKSRLYNPNYGNNPIIIGCGRCRYCRERYASEWAGRLYIENTVSKKSYFLTLTYNDNSLPLKDGLPNLCKKDLQNFIKKLRKNIQVRYYFVGEYGDETLRSHYHGILFFQEDIDYNFLYNLLLSKWNKGHITLKTTVSAHYKYLIKYLSKRLIGKWKYQFIKETGLQPEFSIVSTKPYIGFTIDILKIKRFYYDGFIYNGKQKYAIHRVYAQYLKLIDPEYYYKVILYRDALKYKVVDGIIKPIKPDLEGEQLYNARIASINDLKFRQSIIKY